MGPPKVPQTVYFKRFGTFERVFGVDGGGRPAGRRGRTDGRTHGRTDGPTKSQISRQRKARCARNQI